MGRRRRRTGPLSPTSTPVAPGRDPVLLRTRLLRLLTRVSVERRRAWRASRALGPVVRAAEAFVRRGPIRIAGGIGVGLAVPTEHLPLDHAQAGLIVRGIVEPPVAEALRRHLPPGGVLWDVGANLGYFALLGARIAGPDGEVLAIDPLPGNIDAAAAAAALNGLDQIRAVAVAAWREEGELDLVVPGDGAWAHLAETVAGHASGTRIRVPSIPLDALLEPSAAATPGTETPADAARPPGDGAIPLPSLPVRPPHVVKIDVEGAEIGVLEGLERTVAAYRPVLIVETHGTSDAVAAWAAAHDLRAENLEAATTVGGPAAQLLALVPRER
ncbi:MAG: FkbM family methyltransferase [Solirubrobacteraceae bacterium]